MSTASPAPSKPERRGWRFSLRSLLIFMVVLSIGCAWLGATVTRARAVQRAIEAFEEAGGRASIRSLKRNSPAWLSDVISDRLFKKLDLAFAEIHFSLKGGDSQIKELSHLEHVRILFLSGSGMKDAGLRHLQHWKHLEELTLSGNQFTDAVLDHLAGIKELSSLSLNHIEVTNAGLANPRGIKNLRCLELRGSAVSGAGLVHLAKLNHLDQISLLEHRGALGIAAVNQLKTMKSLTRLCLDETQISPAACRELQMALPNCEIVMVWPRKIIGPEAEKLDGHAPVTSAEPLPAPESVPGAVELVQRREF